MEKAWRDEQDNREKDMKKKMEELQERSNRSAKNATSLRYGDLCIHLVLDLPEGRSLTVEVVEWFATQDMHQWLTWEDMAECFMERFRFNVETVSDRYYLEKVQQKLTENYREFASRWRAEAARVQPPMCEEELVFVFIRSQKPDFYDIMLSMPGRSFTELVKIGEAIEDGLQSWNIASVLNKTSGQATTGIFRKKKKDVARGNVHSTEDCINLKHKIQDLIDKKEITLETATPNVNTNPLPNHGNNGVHMIERDEDWDFAKHWSLKESNLWKKQ
ncbi:uncharacterized protein LOC132601617 [Lycium barbarum]|uniref:uncharacterized protein LOC132601617 n=1 Tax=Lycium barbarum TaxID=112863 RepID=UPI00293E3643|nr:uncharacterized protein LOC132601617 [Lycium barbarum]